MGFTITGNETLLFITTDASKFPFIRLNIDDCFPSYLV